MVNNVIDDTLHEINHFILHSFFPAVFERFNASYVGSIGSSISTKSLLWTVKFHELCDQGLSSQVTWELLSTIFCHFHLFKLQSQLSILTLSVPLNPVIGNISFADIQTYRPHILEIRLFRETLTFFSCCMTRQFSGQTAMSHWIFKSFNFIGFVWTGRCKASEIDYWNLSVKLSQNNRSF